MPPYAQEVDARLAEAVRAALAGIPRVGTVSVWWEGIQGHRRSPPTPATHYLMVRFCGWSPTLHSAQIQLDIDLAEGLHRLSPAERPFAPADPMPDDPYVAVPLVLGMLAAELHRQRMRVTQAEALGFDGPLRRPAPCESETGVLVPIGHLLVDRSAALLMRDLIGPDEHLQPRRILARAVCDIHRGGLLGNGVAHNPGGPVMSVAAVTAPEGAVLDIGLPLDRRARIVGHTVIIGATLPDTVMALAPGRPPADIVDLGAAFADRTIAAMRRTVGPTSIRLVPERITLDEAFP